MATDWLFEQDMESKVWRLTDNGKLLGTCVPMGLQWGVLDAAGKTVMVRPNIDLAVKALIEFAKTGGLPAATPDCPTCKEIGARCQTCRDDDFFRTLVKSMVHIGYGNMIRIIKAEWAAMGHPERAAMETERRPITREEIESQRTQRGGFSKATLAAWGVPWPPPHGWMEKLIRDTK